MIMYDEGGDESHDLCNAKLERPHGPVSYQVLVPRFPEHTTLTQLISEST